MPTSPARTRLALYIVAAYQAIALSTIQFVVPVYVAGGHAPPSHFVANLLLFSLPYTGGFVLAHLVGALIDVTGRVKPFMLLALVAHLAGLLLLAVVRAPWAILLSAALAASFTGTLNTTLKTYVTRISEDAKGAALSQLTSASQLGWLIGGALTALWLVDVTPVSAHTVIVADVALTACTIALVARLLPRLAHIAGQTGHAAPPGNPRHLARGILEDLEMLYREPALVRSCLAAILLVAGNWIFVGTFSVYLVDYLHTPSTSIGWLNVFGALVALALLPSIGRVCDRRGAPAAVRLGAVGYVACYVVLFLFPSVFAAGVVFSIPAYAALLIGLSAAAADIGGVGRRGGGIGVVDGLWAVAIAIGAAAGGLVADLDLARVPLVALVLTSLGLVLAWSQAPRLEERLARRSVLDRDAAAAVDS